MFRSRMVQGVRWVSCFCVLLRDGFRFLVRFTLRLGKVATCNGFADGDLVTKDVCRGGLGFIIVSSVCGY